MPRVKLTAEQKRINKRLRQKNYYDKNREKIILRQKGYNETHKDERKEYQKEYYEEHKEERIEYQTEYNKEYNQTPAGIKSNTLGNWRTYGITFGDMTDSEYYDNIYLPATHCQSCNKIFNKTTKNDEKQADHKHEPLNPCNIRGIICFACNRKDQWKTRLTADSIYHQYL